MKLPGESSVCAAALVAVALFSSYSPSANATTINGITLTGQNIFLDNRGVNDVGENPGPYFSSAATLLVDL
jgi:hypothetical protein